MTLRSTRPLQDDDVVIVHALRSPIGRFGGGLAGVRPDDLAAAVLRAVVEQSGAPADQIDEVFLGCANQAGEDNRNIARMALLLAGLPHHVPGVTVNRLCASGLEAVVQATRAARCGEGALLLAGGVESMSRAPYSMPRGPQMPKAGNVTIYDTSLGWRYPNPRLEQIFPLEAMGETAENVAAQLGLSRADQDAFALASHAKAVAAQAAGAFDAELLPIDVGDAKRPAQLAADEGPRADTTLAALAKLKPAFRANGSVTAGNSSTLNDGAAAVLLATAGKARALGLRPRARVLSAGAAGVDPRVMGLGPVPATRLALQRAGLQATDLDLIELNEAFAAQSLGVITQLGLDADRVNVHGGAIALGHPLGCSGARILTTLLCALERHDKQLGMASLCVGVGQGLSLIIERV